VTLDKVKRLIDIIADITEGIYNNDLIELSGPDTEEPVRAIAQALVRMVANVEARQKHLEMLTKQLEEANQHTQRNLIATVSAMAKALAARDAYTEGHAERVGQISGLIAAELGLSEKDTELVQLAGLLHDIGKIGFPDYLFLPHEESTPKEIVREITRHPTTGAEILKDIDFLDESLPYIRYHHERPDGKGYPHNLKDEEIPLGAKIISVADAFDAMTTNRPYQKARTFQEALTILKTGAGTKWDSGCVSACERILPKIPFHARTESAQQETLQYLASDHPEIALEPGPVGGARMRWLNPGIDFGKYNRLILDRVTFFFAHDSVYKGMDPQELKDLADLFKRQFVDSLKKKYPIVKNPGSDVARIRFAITDLRQNRPVLSDLGSKGLGLSDLQMALMNSWSNTGATSVEVMIFDSMSNSPIAAAKDDQKVGLKEKFTKWGSAEDAFKYWADRLRLFLDQARNVKE